MHKNSVIVEPPLHFALINRNMTAATNQKAARTTTDNIHVKFIERDESDPALLLQELALYVQMRTHSASTQNPVVDGQGQAQGAQGARDARAQGARVCVCVKVSRRRHFLVIACRRRIRRERRPRPALRCTAAQS